MFIRTVATVACFAFAGCGNSSSTSTPATNQKSNNIDTNNLRKKDEEPLVELSGNSEDQACQKALRDVAVAKSETFCKNNEGDRVCQWLYIGPDGKVLYDQRAHEDIDKTGQTRALSCAEALKRYP